jgi:hypothetical protein
MRVIKTGSLCVCVAAVLAGAITTASASALPTFFECHKGVAGSGKYSDTKCSVLAEPGKGVYEPQEGIGKGKPFKGTGGATDIMFPAMKFEITCKSAKTEGTVSGSTTESGVIVTLVSCTELGHKCTTSGHVAGTIVTEPLTGTIGYISKSPLRVGIRYGAEVGTEVAEFDCEGLEIIFRGAVIGEQTGDINAFSKTFSDAFVMTGGGAQAVKSFEGGPTETLEGIVNGSGPFEVAVAMQLVDKGEILEIVA